MLTREQLLEQYKKVLIEQGKEFNLCLITNSNINDIKGGILLVGINPCGEPIGKGVDPYEYECCQTKFWRPKHEMMGKDDPINNYDKKCAYIDLIPIRTKNQNQLLGYLRSENALMGALLSYTQDYIESLSPRLIIYANSLCGLWGLNKTKIKGSSDDKVEYKNAWMGYDFEPIIQSPLEGIEDKGHWPYFKITGIIPSGVNRMRTTSNLIGSFFLRYGQHYTIKGQIPKKQQLTPVDIKRIVESIDPEWAKTLL